MDEFIRMLMNPLSKEINLNLSLTGQINLKLRPGQEWPKLKRFSLGLVISTLNLT